MSIVFDALRAQNNRVAVEQPRRDIFGATRDSLMLASFVDVDSANPDSIVVNPLAVDITTPTAQGDIGMVVFVQDAPIAGQVLLQIDGGVQAIWDQGGPGLSATLFKAVAETTTPSIVTGTGTASGILVTNPNSQFALFKQAVAGETATNGVFVTGYSQRFSVDSPYFNAAQAVSIASWPILDGVGGSEITTGTLVLDLQTGSDITYGEQAFVNTGGNDNTFFAPAVINEDGYTQAMADNGDRFVDMNGVGYLVVGLYTLAPDNDEEGPAKIQPPN